MAGARQSLRLVDQLVAEQRLADVSPYWSMWSNTTWWCGPSPPAPASRGPAHGSGPRGPAPGRRRRRPTAERGQRQPGGARAARPGAPARPVRRGPAARPRLRHGPELRRPAGRGPGPTRVRPCPGRHVLMQLLGGGRPPLRYRGAGHRGVDGGRDRAALVPSVGLLLLAARAVLPGVKQHPVVAPPVTALLALRQTDASSWPVSGWNATAATRWGGCGVTAAAMSGQRTRTLPPAAGTSQARSAISPCSTAANPVGSRPSRRVLETGSPTRSLSGRCGGLVVGRRRRA